MENTTSKKITRKGSSSGPKQTNKLAPYQAQAQKFIRLYFAKDTPDFVRSLLSQWCTALESETQVFWNDRRIAEIALPLMLQKAAAMGLDVENSDSQFCIDVLRESFTYETQTNEYKQGRESERDRAPSISQRTPEQFTDALLLPISPERAGRLAESVLSSGPEKERDLIELLCGLAAITDTQERQEATVYAIRQAFTMHPACDASLQNFIAEIYRRRDDGESESK